MKNLALFIFGIGIVLVTNSFCKRTEIIGNGNTIRKELNFKDFDGVALGSSGDLIITQGSEYKVVYEGDEKVFDKLAIDIKSDGLSIENKEDNWYSNKGFKFYITMPNLKKVALGGSGDIHTTNTFNEEKISIALGGSGDIRIKGRAIRQEVALGGSGDIDLSELSGEVANVAIGGSGNVKVNVSDRLNATIAGSGDISYSGNPSIKETIVGSGEVRKR